MQPKLIPGSFYGKILARVELAGLSLTELAYVPGFKTPRHWHECNHIAIRLQGDSIHCAGNKAVTLRPWSVGYYPPGDAHWDHYQSPSVRNLDIEFSLDHFSSFHDCLRKMNGSFAVNDVALRCVCAKLYSEFRQPDELSALATEGLMMELLAGLFRGGVGETVKKAPLWLQRAEEVVRSRFADSLALADIAEAVGVHPVHLAREFRRFYGSTLGQYVRKRRIEYAIDRISKANCSFADIALAAGFSDQSHFSRTFRNLTGLTPLQFRKINYSG